MAILQFKADINGITATVRHVGVINSAVFVGTDGVPFVANEVLVVGDDYTYLNPGDYSDGVFSFVVNADEVDEENATIVNQITSVQCLLDKVIKRIYDCHLMQTIEAINILIKQGEGDLSRTLYQDVLVKCTKCAELTEAGPQGISIWIVDEDFIVQ